MFYFAISLRGISRRIVLQVVGKRCACAGDSAWFDVGVWSRVCQRANGRVRVHLHGLEQSSGNFHFRLSLRLQRKGNTVRLSASPAKLFNANVTSVRCIWNCQIYVLINELRR